MEENKRTETGNVHRDYLQCMADKWPSAIVARTEVGKFSGGLIKPLALKRIDKAIDRIAYGRLIAYRVSDLIDFMCERSEFIGKEKSLDELIEERTRRGRKNAKTNFRKTGA